MAKRRTPYQAIREMTENLRSEERKPAQVPGPDESDPGTETSKDPDPEHPTETDEEAEQ